MYGESSTRSGDGVGRSLKVDGLRAGLAALLCCFGCLDRPIGAVDPVTTNLFVERIRQTSVDKIDLLFMIDNSSSMSDKQSILRLAVPDLVQRLVNPVCVRRDGSRGATPAAGEDCPEGQTREFNPIENINVAVISSSLGDVGAEKGCPANQGARDNDDLAHTIGSLPRGATPGANSQGFLEWRAGTTNERGFSGGFENMVGAVGPKGCGYEASLESWYRFLVDPAPYRSLVRVPCSAAEPQNLDCVQYETNSQGQVVVDQTLLDQRAAFLRPDSLVAVIMLSDENDCSMQVGGQSWIVADTARRMWRSSSVCDANPNDPCCYICATDPPDGCAADPVCEERPDSNTNAGHLAQADDDVNLRCFDQKRRFGYDFLYPTSRYVNALSKLQLCLGRADLSIEGCPAEQLADNPLFAGGRDRTLVFLGGIVGVLWTAIASEFDSTGRLLESPETTLRFKTVKELNGDGTWAQILGSPGSASSPPVPPANPLMVESPFARPGVREGNPDNGREYDTRIDGTPQDLQYACIFPLPEPRDCAGEEDECDCIEGKFDRPLCEERPAASTASTVQHWAKAYPGQRQLQVLHDYGDNSIVASICARNVDTAQADRPDFGYRPAVDSIVERLKERLGDRCLPRGLLTAADESVPCTLIEALPQTTGACECDPRTARKEPDERTAAIVRSELVRDAAKPCGADDPSCNNACLCEVQQVQAAQNPDPEEALRVCQNDEDASGVEGWCYVADTENQHVGSPALVAACPATSRQVLRFAGQGPARNSITFVQCQGSSLAAQRDVE